MISKVLPNFKCFVFFGISYRVDVSKTYCGYEGNAFSIDIYFALLGNYSRTYLMKVSGDNPFLPRYRIKSNILLGLPSFDRFEPMSRCV